MTNQMTKQEKNKEFERIFKPIENLQFDFGDETKFLKPKRDANMNDVYNVFRDILAKRNQTEKLKILEIGSFYGNSAITMAKTLIQNGHDDATIVCVDHFNGSFEHYVDKRFTPMLMNESGRPEIYEQFISNIFRESNEIYYIMLQMIRPLVMPSSMAFDLFKHFDVTFDIIFVDGSHQYQDVLNDLNNSFKILNENGIIFGDDYNNFTGVKMAVDRFSHEFGYPCNKNIIDNNYFVLKFDKF